MSMRQKLLQNTRFDPTVSVGDVIQIVVILGTLVVSGWFMSARLASIETKLEPLWQDYNRRIERAIVRIAGDKEQP